MTPESIISKAILIAAINKVLEATRAERVSSNVSIESVSGNGSRNSRKSTGSNRNPGYSSDLAYSLQSLLGSMTKSSEYNAPSEEELRRMYSLLQADARMSQRLKGLGFGNNGDAYRIAAIKLQLRELLDVLKDGKRTRNDIVHKPGYIPSEQDVNRALQEYGKAEESLNRRLIAKKNPVV